MRCIVGKNGVDAMLILDYKPRHEWRPFGRPIAFVPGRWNVPGRTDQTKREAFMANTTSAKKATRKIAARTAVNKGRRSRVRTYVRFVEEALAAGDKTKALAAFKDAQPELMRAATKGVMHKNTASRKVSRLAQRVKALA